MKNKYEDFKTCPNCGHIVMICHDGDTYHSDDRFMRLECFNRQCDYYSKISEVEYKRALKVFNK